MIMEDNSRKSKHLPWPLLIVMGIGGTIIASLLTSMVALAVRGNVFVYGVLSIVAIAFAIVIARDDGSDNKDVQSLLVAYPLFIVGFAFGYVAGDHHLTLTLVLQKAKNAAEKGGDGWSVSDLEKNRDKAESGQTMRGIGIAVMAVGAVSIGVSFFF